MNISEHTRIFKSYIDRMRFDDIEKINDCVMNCMQQTLNGNANSQLDADFALHTAIMTAMESLLTHDRDNITKIVSNTVNREG
jgi:DNA-binding FadR family transcriptional regulator